MIDVELFLFSAEQLMIIVFVSFLTRRGTYFAEKSSYSDSYAYSNIGFRQSSCTRPPLKADEKELFLVTLLEGRPKHLLIPDANLLVPPVDPSSGQRYNSVTAETRGSKIWVVYENGRAYPSYLVRYYRGYRDRARSPLSSKPKPTFLWEFENDQNGWTEFSTTHQAALENVWKADKKTLVLFTSYHRYHIDLAQMKQTNISDPARKVRSIRRRELKSMSIGEFALQTTTGNALVGLAATVVLMLLMGGKKSK